MLRRETGRGRVWPECSLPSQARSKSQAWAGVASGFSQMGFCQISAKESAGTKPRFLPLLTRMKPSLSLLLLTPTQI